MDNALAGKVAIVTGASSGIGAATASVLAGAGARVMLAARREDRLEELVAAIVSEGGQAAAHRTDVSVRADVEALVKQTVALYGRVDILVNNAGVMPLSPLSEGRVDDWEQMVDINIKGVLYGLGAVLPVMMEQHSGHIVNIGSVAGRRPFPGGSVYSATKFAVRALSWGLHLELGAEHGIRVTDVQPGVVETELPDHIPDAGARERFKGAWADRRPLQSEDVARSVLFAVASPDHVSVSEILVRPTDQPT
jgi:NADP-dependent 3-hydroxy acid dehydrogenase YdfG